MRITKDDIGRKMININDEVYTIIGFEEQSEFPIIAERNGCCFLFNMDGKPEDYNISKIYLILSKN